MRRVPLVEINMSNPYVSTEYCQKLHSIMDGKHNEIITAISELKAEVIKLRDSIYVDNGRTSIQTRLDRHDRVLKTIIWAVGIYFVAMTPIVISVVGQILKHVLYGV